MNYEEMTYKQLDALWYEKHRAQNLACGTPEHDELGLEMAEIKEWMALKEAEWNTPERLASGQRIHVGAQLPGKCKECGAGILAASKFCHACGAAQG